MPYVSLPLAESSRRRQQPMPASEPGTQADYYTILALPRPLHRPHSVSKDEVKTAYHHALLLHHPDRETRSTSRSASIPSDTARTQLYTVDQIVQAYQTLSDPVLKHEYDRGLLERDKVTGWAKDVNHTGTHLGVEVFDLDDLEYNNVEKEWSKTCRCGNDIGYRIAEQDLEEASEGEIYIGCRGCSLFIKVLFDVVGDGQ